MTEHLQDRAGPSYRVLVVAQEYPDDRSLKGIWCEQQVRALAERHRCRVVVPEEATNGNATPVSYERHGVPIARYRYLQARKQWWLPYLRAVLRGVRSEGRGFRPDLLHAHMGTRAGWATVIAGKLLRLPVVVTEHWGTVAERLSGDRLAAWALRYAIRNADEWIAVSRALAREIDVLGLRPPVPVIGNVLDPVFLRPVQPAPQTPELRLVTVGRIDNRAKGLDILLQALALVNARPGIDWSLEVLGDGPARSEFEALARELRLAERVSFAGWCPPTGVAARLQAASCFVMASDYETFGLAYMEALALGRPVIGCAVGALPELIPDWAGLLVAPKNPEAIAEAVRRMSVERERFVPERLAEHARRTCSPELFREQVTAVYERVLQRRGRARG